MKTDKELVYLDLFDDGHHFEHAIHLIRYYISNYQIFEKKLFICVSDSLASRLKENLSECAKDNFPIFIPLTLRQLKFVKYRNRVKNNRYKLLVSNILDIYVIVYLKIRYNKTHFLINVLNNLVIPLLFLQIFFWRSRIEGIYFNPLFRSKYSKSAFVTNRYKISQIIDEARLFLFSKLKVVQRIFLLGDKTLVRYYNNKYSSKKFDYVGDPFFIIDTNFKKNTKLIVGKKISVLCFGALQVRKGIILIMDAILNMDESLLRRFHFYFIGKVDKTEREFIYNKRQQVDESGRGESITITDSFIGYNELVNKILEHDIIYAGYESYGASSGVLSWAASFYKPIICIKKSLIGKLAEQCGLALSMNGYLPKDLICILQEICETKTIKFSENGIQMFLSENTPDNFSKTLLKQALI